MGKWRSIFDDLQIEADEEVLADLAALFEPPEATARSFLGNLLFHARPRWQRDGLCHEHPEVDFFADSSAGTARAKAVCADCLVIDECREFAIEGHEHGTWGGTSTRERTAIRMARQRGQEAA